MNTSIPRYTTRQRALNHSRERLKHDGAEAQWILISMVAPLIVGMILGAGFGLLLAPPMPDCVGDGSYENPFIVTASGCSVPGNGHFFATRADQPQLEESREASIEP